jgi:hypothetical protein
LTLGCGLAVSASKQEAVKQTLCYELDLSMTGRNGDFLSPGCGFFLSPDDETGKNYLILETTVNSTGLESLIVQCQRCDSKIRLVGFFVGDPIEGEKW